MAAHSPHTDPLAPHRTTPRHTTPQTRLATNTYLLPVKTVMHPPAADEHHAPGHTVTDRATAAAAAAQTHNKQHQ